MNYRDKYVYDVLQEADGSRKGQPVEVAMNVKAQTFDATNAPSTVAFQTRTKNMNYASYMAQLHLKNFSQQH